jgi:hypothetical protein
MPVPLALPTKQSNNAGPKQSTCDSTGSAIESSKANLIIHWRAGKDNLADYFTKHHSPAHHKLMRLRYLLEFHKPTT